MDVRANGEVAPASGTMAGPVLAGIRFRPA